MTDINDQDSIEQELLLFKEIVKNMAEGVYLVRISDVMIVYTNPKFEKMFGYNPGEMLNKHASIVNAPTDKDPKEIAKEIMQVIADTGEWHGEVNNIKKDGTSFWCYANVSVIDHPKYGKVLVAVHSDITERKILEEKVKESEDWFKVMFENSNEGIFRLSAEGKILSVNPAFAKMHGYTVDEIMKMNIADLDSPECAKSAPERMKKLLAGESLIFEVEHLRKDGQIIPLEVSASSVAVEGKKYILAFHRDITERKKEEKALQDIHLQLNESQHLAKVGSWSWIVATDVCFWSDELYRINGRDPKLPAVPYAEQSSCYTKESWSRVDTAVKNTLATGKPYKLELELIREDGEHRLCFVQGEAIKDENGKIIQLTGIVQDITERKKLEESLTRFALMVENTSDYTSVADMKGNLLYLNQAGKKIIGLEENTDISELKIANVHPEWASKIILEKGIPEAIEKGIWNGETALLHRDGHEIPVSQVIMTHKNSAGEVDLLATIMRDITQVKKIQEQNQKTIIELQRFKEAVVGRELKMIELKKSLDEANNKIKELEIKA